VLIERQGPQPGLGEFRTSTTAAWPVDGGPSCWANYNNYVSQNIACRPTSASCKGDSINKLAYHLLFSRQCIINVSYCLCPGQLALPWAIGFTLAVALALGYCLRPGLLLLPGLLLVRKVRSESCMHLLSAALNPVLFFVLGELVRHPGLDTQTAKAHARQEHYVSSQARQIICASSGHTHTHTHTHTPGRALPGTTSSRTVPRRAQPGSSACKTFETEATHNSKHDLMMMISLVPDGTLSHMVKPELLRCGGALLSAGLLARKQNWYGRDTLSWTYPKLYHGPIQSYLGNARAGTSWDGFLQNCPKKCPSGQLPVSP
jgi:hypothetical protein